MFSCFKELGQLFSKKTRHSSTGFLGTPKGAGRDEQEKGLRLEAASDNDAQKAEGQQQPPAVAITIRKPTGIDKHPSATIREPTVPIEEPVPSRTISHGSLAPRSSHRNSISSASQRSRSNSKESTACGHVLKGKLHAARRECPRHHLNFFVPECKQEQLVTQSAVADDIQARNPDIERAQATEIAKVVCHCAKKLYATLAYLKKGADIGQLLEEGITDDDLPLIRRPNERSQFALERRSGIPIKVLEQWDDSRLEKFDRVQWWMNSPMFEEGGHYNLDDKDILPFIPFTSQSNLQDSKQSGYSEVYPVRIHPAHHTFWDSPSPEDREPLVAVKQLFSHDMIEFYKEETILKALGTKNHPHLIKLLATYRQKQTYHLMFPFADANLRKYWEDRPTPTFDRETVLWSVKQMKGIASGILLVHKFTVTFNLSVAGAGEGQVRLPKGVKLSVSPGEEMYGRHGDIKPENVLWFDQSADIKDRLGVLKIADFGLGRFHGRDSRSGVNPAGVLTSPTYEPPECKLREPVSRAYDIWSIGCLYLEFITWLLKGSEDIDRFSDFRGKDDPDTGINDDNFFTITLNEYGRSIGRVREEVKVWVTDLHSHPKCSALVHDVLNLTMKELLVIDSKERCDASGLNSQLALFLRKAEFDDEYLLAPVPDQQKPGTDRTNSTPEMTREPKTNGVVQFPNANGGEVLFPARPQSKSQSRSILSKDLVGRSAGTPSLPKPKIGGTHGSTWPIVHD